MPAAADNRIDRVMEDASVALASGRYFDAERLALEALGIAHNATDYERMARITLPLQEARRHRMQQALDIDTIFIHDESQPVTEEMNVDPGCYLITPMLVGADARRLRLLAMSRDIPVLIVCREPPTRLGLVPIVTVGGGMTVRTRVDGYDEDDGPDMAWFVEALRELGNEALRTLDPIMDASRRVTALVDRLDAVPEHEALHQRLAEECRLAHDNAVAASERRKNRG